MIWLLLISVAFGQEDKQSTVVYKERTEIDFEDLEIEGQMIKPQGALVTDRKGATFNPLIQLRLDFSPEMSQSVTEIK